MSGTSLKFKYKNLIFPMVTLWSVVGSQCSNKHPFFLFSPESKIRKLAYCISIFVGGLACKYQLKYQWLDWWNIKSWKCRRRKMLQADSTGRVRLTLIVRIRDFFRSQITGDYHDSCDFIRKIAFTFVGRKNGDWNVFKYSWRAKTVLDSRFYMFTLVVKVPDVLGRQISW